MGLRNKLSFSGFLFCALLILILPLRWLIASVFAAVFHEICHIAAVKLCGKKVEHIWLCDNGLTMETPDLLPWQELVCSMAGPAGLCWASHGDFLCSESAHWYRAFLICCLSILWTGGGH